MSGMCTLFLLLVIVGFHLIYSAFGLGFLLLLLWLPSINIRYLISVAIAVFRVVDGLSEKCLF